MLGLVFTEAASESLELNCLLGLFRGRLLSSKSGLAFCAAQQFPISSTYPIGSIIIKLKK